VAQVELTILGGGSWGTALSIALAPRFERIHLWVHSPDLAALLERTRVNEVYLPGFTLPPNVRATSQLTIAPWVLSVVPSRHLRHVLTEVAAQTTTPISLISATKGIEAGTFLRMSEIARQCFGAKLASAPAALTGPTFAREIAAGSPAAIVIASADETFARDLQASFATGHLRFYTNTDIIGAELAGALKNIIAIAAGAAEGLGLGGNSSAALITRGLAEIGRLVLACGGRAETVSGLAGLGDLVLTCTGQLSRNRRVGIELAKGRALSDIVASTPMVAEGISTTAVALQLAAIKGVELPIAQAVQAMLDGQPAATALARLVTRAARAE